MKRYLLKCLALALAVLLPFGGWIWYVLSLPDHLGASLAATVRYKIDLLQTTPGPRVILAGGSSSPYGTDCALAAEELGVNVINVGSTAYLGLEMYLRLLEEYTREGDVVVLGPEYTMMIGPSVNYELVWMGAGSDADVWRVVPPGYVFGLFCSLGTHYTAKTGRIPADGSEPDPAAHHTDFGPLGDVTAQRETLLEHGYILADTYDMTADDVSGENLARIRASAKRLAERGVRLLYAFAPVSYHSITSSDAEVAAYEARIREGVDIPVILGLDRARMDGAYFYDSNNHLTSAGAALYTSWLIEGLQPYVSAD